MKNIIEDFFASRSVKQVIVLGLILALLFFVLNVGVIGTASIFVLNGLFHLGLEYSLYNYSVTTVAWLLVRKLFKQYKD